MGRLVAVLEPDGSGTRRKCGTAKNQESYQIDAVGLIMVMWYFSSFLKCSSSLV